MWTLHQVAASFFFELGNGHFGEYREVAAEGQAHHNEADTVAKFEYRFLDEKSGRSNMERLLKDGADIFYIRRPIITEKYRYLWPSDFKLNALETWEARWTFPMVIPRAIRALMRGTDLFAGFPPEVRQKYAHLVPDFRFRNWLLGCLSTERGRRWIQGWIAQGADIFLFSDPPGTGLRSGRQYPRLIPHGFMMNPLATFEFFWLDRGTISIIEWFMKQGGDVFRGWADLVEEKHGHLRSLMPLSNHHSHPSPHDSNRGQPDGREKLHRLEGDQDKSDSLMCLSDQHNDSNFDNSEGDNTDASGESNRPEDDQDESDFQIPLSGRHEDLAFEVSNSSDSDSDESNGSEGPHQSNDDQEQSGIDYDDDGEEEHPSSNGDTSKAERHEEGSDAEENMLDTEQLLRGVIFWDERARTSKFWYRDRLRAKYRYL